MTTDVDHLAELDDPNDPDSDYGRGYRAALDAVLAALRNEAEQQLARAHDLPERAYARGIAYSSYFLEPWLREGAGIVRRLAATTPPPRPSEPQTAEQTEVVPQATPGPRTAGICGTTAPTIAQGATDMICTLPAGHAGWHHADNGADFTLGESLTYEELESERDRLARELYEAQTELADRTAERDEAHALMVQARAERDRLKSPIGQVVITPAAQSAGIPPQVVVDELWRAGWRPPGGTR